MLERDYYESKRKIRHGFFLYAVALVCFSVFGFISKSYGLPSFALAIYFLLRTIHLGIKWIGKPKLLLRIDQSGLIIIGKFIRWNDLATVSVNASDTPAYKDIIFSFRGIPEIKISDSLLEVSAEELCDIINEQKAMANPGF